MFQREEKQLCIAGWYACLTKQATKWCQPSAVKLPGLFLGFSPLLLRQWEQKQQKGLIVFLIAGNLYFRRCDQHPQDVKFQPVCLAR